MGKHFSLGPGAKRVTDASFVDEMLFRSGFRTTSTKKGKASVVVIDALGMGIWVIQSCSRVVLQVY